MTLSSAVFVRLSIIIKSVYLNQGPGGFSRGGQRNPEKEVFVERA